MIFTKPLGLVRDLIHEFNLTGKSIAQRDLFLAVRPDSGQGLERILHGSDVPPEFLRVEAYQNGL